jgi:hypothetical protein
VPNDGRPVRAPRRRLPARSARCRRAPSYEARLVTCWRCQASLAGISAIVPLLAGLDESVFATPPEAAPTPVPGTLLSRLLKAAGRDRARRRSGPKPAPRAMAALVATPVHATIALQPRPWGTEIDLTCWYQRGTAEPPSDRCELVAHGADGATYDLGSWQPTPGRKVIFTSGTALTGTQIKNLQVTQSNGPAILTLGVARLFRAADRQSGQRAAARPRQIADLRSRRDKTGPVHTEGG